QRRKACGARAWRSARYASKSRRRIDIHSHSAHADRRACGSGVEARLRADSDLTEPTLRHPCGREVAPSQAPSSLRTRGGPFASAVILADARWPLRKRRHPCGREVAPSQAPSSLRTRGGPFASAVILADARIHLKSKRTSRALLDPRLRTLVSGETRYLSSPLRRRSVMKALRNISRGERGDRGEEPKR